MEKMTDGTCSILNDTCPEKNIMDCRYCQLHSVVEDYRDRVYRMQEENDGVVGVIVPTESSRCNNWRELTVIKNAKRINREKSLSEMLFMMFRSASRDRYKLS